MDLENNKFFIKHEIKPEEPEVGKVPIIGFSEKEQKWYGWSHRAIYGFGIGSTCKKGDCHYTADNPEEMIDDYANFFADISEECAEEHRKQCVILPDRTGIIISKPGIEIPVVDNLDDLQAALEDEIEPEKQQVLSGTYIQKCGKGEWVAETLEDAKQMAEDFAEDVG